MKSAQLTLSIEGNVIIDKYGAKKMHPCVMIERDSRLAMLSAFKQLNLKPKNTSGFYGYRR